MQETAVGLFDNPGIADAVVNSLRERGVASQNIRVVAAPTGTSGDDFGTGFTNEMKTMGVPEYETGAYLTGLGTGSVIVFATGDRTQAAEALSIMNEYGALELDAFSGSSRAASTDRGVVTGTGDLGTVNPEPRLPESSVTIGEHEHTYTSHASRSKSEGARIFTW